MKTSKQYAFWRYDQFPYVLSGTVTKTLPNGNVEVEGYGTGTTGFKPILVVPEPRGKLIAKSLERLTQYRERQVTNINRECESQMYHISTELYLHLKKDGVIKL